VCDECQKRRRVTVYDRIPIPPVPCNEKVFDSWVMDCLGPLFPNQKVKYNYCVVLCDRVSRFRTNLEVAGSYATEHGKRQQQRYVTI